MTTQMRGKNVAIGGALLQIAFTVVMLILWAWTKSASAMAAMWLLAGGVLLWLMVTLLFYTRQLELQEAMELEEMSKRGAGTKTIFEGEGAEEQRSAAARAEWMRKWMVPVFTLAWAGYHVATGVIMLRYLAGRSAAPLNEPLQGTMFMFLLAFSGFLFSRYASGMSLRPEWRLLRAAGSYLLINVLAIVASMAALLAASWAGKISVDWAIAHVLPVVQLILAAELALNLILDIYRPRLPGQEYRPSFESRVYTLLADPGRVGHSIAEAVNYQFGFEVSRTWFYQLLSRALLPLVLFGVAVLFAMTCVVIVHDDERAIVTVWGKAPDGWDTKPVEQTTLGPGLHFKYPWPVSEAHKYKNELVRQIDLGVGGERKPTIVNGRELFLWTEEHGAREEKDFLIGIPVRMRRGESDVEGAAAPAVNIIKLVLGVQYRVADPYRYAYGYADAAKVLECLAYREMTRYCAAATLDERVGGAESQRPEGLMSFGRGQAANQLRERIAQAAKEHDLGVEILYVGILSAHPPAAASPAFEDVLKAERARDAKIYKAEAEAAEMLAKVAGRPEIGRRLGHSIARLEELQSLQEVQSNPNAFRDRLDSAIRLAQGRKRDIEKLQEHMRMRGLKVPEAGSQPATQPAGKFLHQTLYEDVTQYLSRLESFRRAVEARQPCDLPRAIAEASADTKALREHSFGEGEAMISQALAKRWQQELAERARATAFEREMQAYEACPQVYTLSRYLDVWDEFLPRLSKQVIALDPDRVELWLNYEKEPGVMQGATFQRPGEEQSR
ncbi:MAG TPA: hypothetical protein DCX07_05440 [Phycisphaerales bacterium]|nr:hypothetical protein [Phycisphaerales bacterium]